MLVAYIAVMLYQGYHTLTDIVTTTAAIAPSLCLYHWGLLRARDDKGQSA